jgi:CO/xanthine dehydrogenase Mo-binding subunit
MLYGITIRSPVSRGRLEGIELPEMPNSYTLIRAKDIPGENRLEDFPVPILAPETLSYIGEPVALLVGPDEAKLEEYAAKTRVMVREEPPVSSIEEFKREKFEQSGSGDIIAARNIRTGKEDFAFTGDLSPVQGTYASGSQEHWYPEPHGAVAILLHPSKDTAPKDGARRVWRLKVYTATQWPFHVKRSLTGMLQIDGKYVSVVPTQTGVHLDGKIWYPSLIACHAALGAFVTRKPVKLMLTREEDFCFSPKRNSSGFFIRSAIGKKGEILGTEIRALTDLGAQGVFAREILDRLCLAVLGLYRHGSIRLDGFAVETNIPPPGASGRVRSCPGVFRVRAPRIPNCRFPWGRSGGVAEKKPRHKQRRQEKRTERKIRHRHSPQGTGLRSGAHRLGRSHERLLPEMGVLRALTVPEAGKQMGNKRRTFTGYRLCRRLSGERISLYRKRQGRIRGGTDPG